MRRSLLFATVAVAVSTCAAVAAAPDDNTASLHTHARQRPHAALHSKAHAMVVHGAPADEYFGRQKLSVLGIRNSLHDLNIRYDGSPGRVQFALTAAAPIEDAMRDWNKKYPGDRWLGHYLFLLDLIYMRMPTEEGRALSKTLGDQIVSTYPNTYYSKYVLNARAVTLKAHTATPAPTENPFSILNPVDGEPKSIQPTPASGAAKMPSVQPSAQASPQASVPPAQAPIPMTSSTPADLEASPNSGGVSTAVPTSGQ